MRRLLNKGGMKNNQLSKLETVSLKKQKPASGRYRKWHRKEFTKADEEIIRCKKKTEPITRFARKPNRLGGSQNPSEKNC